MEPSAKIPLCARDGSVKAEALVDPEDYEWASRHRWHLTSNGYAARGVWHGEEKRKETLLLHREVLNPPAGESREVDHINGDKLDNRLSNLRMVTRCQNSQNLRPRKGGTSRYRGVSLCGDTGRWRARVEVEGTTHRLGRFDSEDEAAKAAEDFRARHMPFAVG